MPTESTNIGFAFRYGTKAAMDNTSVSNGCWNICLDSGQLFLDWENRRIPLTDILLAENLDELNNINNPENKIYFCKEDYCLYKYEHNYVEEEIDNPNYIAPSDDSSENLIPEKITVLVENGSWKRVSGTTDYAMSAESDGEGNNIIDTYATRADLDIVSVNLENLINTVGNVNRFNVVACSIDELPEIGEQFTIYMCPDEFSDESEESRKNSTIEYIWMGGDEDGYYEQIGVTDTDLTQYYTKTEIDDKLDEIDQNVDLLESKVDNNKTTADNAISQINTKITNLTTTVNDNKTETDSKIDEVQNRITSVDNRVTTANNNISSINNQITQIQNEITSIETGGSESSTDIGNLKSDVSDLKTDVADLKSADTTINNKITQITNSVSSLDGRIAAIENSSTSSEIIAIQDDISDIKTEQNNIKGSISDLQTALNNYKSDVENDYIKKEDAISSVTMDGNIMVFHYGDGHTETLTINNLVKYESDDTILYEDEE